jgi:hypothetical protein
VRAARLYRTHRVNSDGADLAREHGVADLDESGEWVVGDLSRLDRD